ncbi:MAG: filamentous hemagglutinin N-terminal domain-containing protein [Cyanobacteria bacterium J06643_5]
MKGIVFLSGFISVFLSSGIVLPAYSQVTSDSTTNTTVNQINNNFNILNGIQKGNNLFHSFKEFSIPTGGSANFQNSSAIENIINRVTGGNISNIDGLIKAQGNANLFLINPNGIVFGENSRLDIGGSFFGSTAESILFADGFEFSAVNPQNEPLLTISVPVGLQMGVNPGIIEVNGNGHNLIAQDIDISPSINPENLIPQEQLPLYLRPGLQVQPGKSLFLVGGDITLDGGVLNAQMGRVELSSVKQGIVNVNVNNQGFELNIPEDLKSGNIQLSQKALVDAGAGSIAVNGSSVSLKNGSVLFLQNRGLHPAGNIDVTATESLEINEISSDGKIRAAIINETLAGIGGNISVVTPRLVIKNGGAIGSKTFSSAPGGNISLDVSESIQVVGSSKISPTVYSAIASVTFSDGKAGDLIASTKNFSVLDSAVVSGASLGNGNGGTLNINAQTLEVKGSGLGLLVDSGIATTAFSNGNAGNISIHTKNMVMDGGAFVTTVSHNSGNGGNLTINATESVKVVGKDADGRSTRLHSNVRANLDYRGVLANLPDVPTGDAGSISINTPLLLVGDEAFVSVDNLASGDAGTLKVDADFIKLNNLGKLSATTVFGEGGDISLQSRSLQIRGESIISTSAGGKGNGGNITINTDTLVALENSDITANAQNSFAGKVTINAQGIFGTQFREELTPFSDITASSDLGAEFNGVVELNTPGIDPSSGIVELPTDVVDSSKQIASGCNAQTGNSFVATGRGGIPENPNEQVDANLNWSDIRDLSTYRKRKSNIQTTQIPNKTTIVEATGFISNKDGEIELVAAENKPLNTKQVSECSGINT